MMKLREFICLSCGQPFSVGRKEASYCSHLCWGAKRHTDAEVACICKWCGKEFVRLKAQTEGTLGQYCSVQCQGHDRKRDVAERFWSHVDKRGPDECWPWVGALSNRYGVFCVGAGKNKLAHVLSWELTNGPLPEGKQGNHIRECPLRACCNPNHIYAGTQLENMQDASASDNPPGRKAIIPEETIIEILRLLKEKTMRQKEIAKQFNLSPGTISNLRHGTYKRKSLYR